MWGWGWSSIFFVSYAVAYAVIMVVVLLLMSAIHNLISNSNYLWSICLLLGVVIPAMIFMSLSGFDLSAHGSISGLAMFAGAGGAGSLAMWLAKGRHA